MTEDYRECPFFSEGPTRCCGACHNAERSFLEDERVAVPASRGRIKVVQAHSLSPVSLEVIHDRICWKTEVSDSPEVAAADISKLSPSSADDLFFVRERGREIITQLQENCPFNHTRVC